MLHVLKLAYVLDPKLAPLPADLIPKAGKTVDPTIIFDLDKQRALRSESEELCVGHIKNSLSDRLYDLYAPVKDLRELWSTLELKYKAHEESTNKYLVSKYLEFQMVDDKPIMEQVMVNKLNVLTISIPELFQVGAIIAKLPPSWKDFSKIMMHKSEDYSLDDLMKHLHIEEETRTRDKHGKFGSSVHHVSAGGSGHKTKFGGQNKRNLGPKKQSFKKPSHQNPNSKSKRVGLCHVCREIGHYARECKDHKLGPVALAVEKVTNMVASVNLGDIFMISSLTQAIYARGWFVDVRSTVHACGQRESFSTYHPMPPGMLKFTHGELVTLQYVLHVPTISKGLVSADKFEKGGFKMELEKGTIVITKGRRYVGRVNNCSGMNLFYLSDEGSASGSSVDSNGAGVACVSSVASNDVISGLVANVNEVNFFCYAVCSISLWHKRLAHTNVKNIEKNAKLNGILSREGRRKRRGIFNQEFDTFCEENGIKHERTSPYTPQQNGLAERKNQALCEMVNSMLNQSGRKPNLDYLKVWGCVAYYRTPNPKRTKLGARANKSIFIGYAHNIKTYRLLDIESGVAMESRDVEFFEDKFSRDDENSSHKTPTSTSREILSPPPIVEEPRRSTRARIEKSFGDDFYSYLAKGTQKKVMREVIFSINLVDDPKTFTKAMTSRDAPLWKEAINEEMDSIMGNGN
uniref:Integrase catalytic domain-containing protein n=1 Tax=Lactuca sativa TaxID=4236 RepID=A0A9R1VHL9_LACSA|nr:hypothetical protein LSAT_V11C500270260 [Lactuca sativa]